MLNWFLIVIVLLKKRNIGAPNLEKNLGDKLSKLRKLGGPIHIERPLFQCPNMYDP